MTVYYVTCFTVFVILLLSQRCDKHYERDLKFHMVSHSQSTTILFMMALLVLVFVAGFRYAVGTDYFAYYKNYETYAAEFYDSIKTFNEPGFRLLCLFIIKLGGTGVTVIFLASATTIILSMRSIYKNTYYLTGAVALYIFLGCWHSGFNAIRQCIAAAIVFSGIRFIKERKIISYVIVILLASTFHVSALVMIVAYFFVNNKINVKNVVLLSVVCAAILYSFDRVLLLVSTLLNTTYTLDDGYIYSEVNSYRVLVAVVPALVFIFMYSHRRLDKEKTLWINFLILNAVAMIVTSNSTYLARVGIYTAPFTAIGIPELINGLSERNKRVLNFCIYPLFAIYWWYEISHSENLSTFQFIWER